MLQLFSDKSNSFNFMKHLPFIDHKLQDDEIKNTGISPCQEPFMREDQAESDDENDLVRNISTIKWSHKQTNKSTFDT